jgi:hypothetical protein
VDVGGEPSISLNTELEIDITSPSIHGQPSPVYDAEPQTEKEILVGDRHGEVIAIRRGESTADEGQASFISFIGWCIVQKKLCSLHI